MLYLTFSDHLAHIFHNHLYNEITTRGASAGFKPQIIDLLTILSPLSNGNDDYMSFGPFSLILRFLHTSTNLLPLLSFRGARMQREILLLVKLYT